MIALVEKKVSLDADGMRKFLSSGKLELVGQQSRTPVAVDERAAKRLMVSGSIMHFTRSLACGITTEPR